MVSDRISARASRFGQSMARSGNRMKKAAQDDWDSLRGTTADYVTEGRVRARRVGRWMEHDIRHHPMRWLALSAALGIGAGLAVFFFLTDRDPA
jgi:hypothetical protein